MLQPPAMPNGVRVFLVYALIVLWILGLTLPLIVAEASSDVPISPLGLPRWPCWRTSSSPYTRAPAQAGRLGCRSAW